MLVSGIQQSDSIIHIHVSILFQTDFLQGCQDNSMGERIVLLSSGAETTE